MVITNANNYIINLEKFVFVFIIGTLWVTSSFLFYKNMEESELYSTNGSIIFYSIILPPALLVIVAFSAFAFYAYLTCLSDCLWKILNCESFGIFEIIFIISAWNSFTYDY